LTREAFGHQSANICDSPTSRQRGLAMAFAAAVPIEIGFRGDADVTLI
jgi:hypothetical protein